MKRVLITGANSYLGVNVERWLWQFPEEYEVDTIDMKGEGWKEYDFSQYQVIFHVAALVHLNLDNRSETIRDRYYGVNTWLAVDAAKKAKLSGVKQFIFMSSMSVYGDAEHITWDTMPAPQNFYGESKWKAEQDLEKLSDGAFKVAILRPPMVYGKGAKGNYPILSKIAKRTLIFPAIDNRRSMIYIENLCEFVKLIIDNEDAGVFFPQDREWVNTRNMVQIIADVSNHRIWFTKALMPFVWLGSIFPGEIGRMCKKAFGNCYYDMEMSSYKDEYRIYSLKAAIERTER